MSECARIAPVTKHTQTIQTIFSAPIFHEYQHCQYSLTLSQEKGGLKKNTRGNKHTYYI